MEAGEFDRIASTRHAFLLDGSAGCTNDSTPATMVKLFTLLSAAQGAAGQHLLHRVVATNVQATGDVITCIAVSGSTLASCWTYFAMINMLDIPMLAREGRANGLEIRLAVVATDVLMTTLIDYQRLQKRARRRHVHVPRRDGDDDRSVPDLFDNNQFSFFRTDSKGKTSQPECVGAKNSAHGQLQAAIQDHDSDEQDANTDSTASAGVPKAIEAVLADEEADTADATERHRQHEARMDDACEADLERSRSNFNNAFPVETAEKDLRLAEAGGMASEQVAVLVPQIAGH